MLIDSQMGNGTIVSLTLTLTPEDSCPYPEWPQEKYSKEDIPDSSCEVHI
jgi:hypothetical protein